MKFKWLVYLFLASLLLIGGCSSENASEPPSSPKPAEEEQDKESNEEEPVQEDSDQNRVTIKAVGDILIHERVYRDAETAEGYNFEPMLAETSEYLQDADITIANQETMIGGEEIGLSTYPAFNSPKAVGDALKSAGIDLVTIANNHTLDRGEAAIQSAIEHWREIGVEYTGAFRDQEDSGDIRVIEANGITTAFLSYTYGTNGIPVPEGKPYLVNLIDREKIIAEIEQAKQQADAVVVSYHAGVEYEPLPTQEQKDLAQLAADQGADAVIGHHPHVLQPAEWVEGKDGNRTFVIYSLGNFLSGQDEYYNQIGGIVSFDLKKEEDGEVQVVDPAFAITFVDFNNQQNYRVLPMYNLSSDEVKNAPQHYEQTKEHMKQWMPDLTIVEDW